MKTNSVLYFAFIFVQHIYAQLPDYGSAFLQDEVASIKISIHPDTLLALLSEENWGNDREFPANFIYESSEINESVSDVSFRLRGNTSLSAAKKSFKISFNTFVEGRKWMGLEKMNINGSHNDPSMIRAALCWNAIRRAGLPGSRVSFVKLYINEEYKGLYSNIEHIDEEFADLYFPGSQFSSQYKCLYPAPLDFISNNAGDYNFIEFNRRPYDQKINDYTNDYRDLSGFIDVLNNSPSEQFACLIERIFNVDNFLKYSAIDALTGNWDGYGYNKNNYYLQVNYHTGQFEFIPYDLDNSLGIDWVGIDWAERNINSWWNQSESRPLVEKIMEIPEYTARYNYYIRNYAEGLLHADTLRNIAQGMLELINEAALADVYRTLDYGFTFEDFQNSLDSAWGNQVNYGIIEFQQLRNSNAIAQLDAPVAIEPMIQGGYFNPFSNDAFAHCDAAPNISVYIELSSNIDFINALQPIELFDNGLQPDMRAGDGVYSAAVSQAINLEGPAIYYRFISTSLDSEHHWPCTERTVYRDTLNLHYLNEIMSNNENVIANPDGDYSDWIEIHNPYSQSWVSDGYFISDDPERPNKWALPALTLNQGMYHLFWANALEDLSRNYTNFRISASGEWLGLFKKIDDHYRLVQYINVPGLNDDESYGQFPEGSGNWLTFVSGSSTAGQINGTAGKVTDKTEELTIYPNPANETLYFSKNIKVIRVLDSTGKIILNKNNCTNIDLSDLCSGIYILQTNEKRKLFVVTK